VKTKRKTSSNKGFTLAETLLAVLILLLVSTIVATGIPAARNAYEKVVVASNAQAVLSTAATALRDELGTGWDIQIGSDQSITYNSAKTGALSKLFLTPDEGIKLQEYGQTNAFNTDNITYAFFLNNNESSSISVDKSRRLIAEKAGPGDSSGNLIVTYEGVSYANNCVVISNLSVGSAAYPNLASIESLTIPVISAKTTV